MKTFEVKNPTLTLSSATEEVRQLIQNELKIKFKINQTEIVSQSVSLFNEENKIQWKQIFVLHGIPEGENKVEATVIEGQDILMSFEGELVVTQSSQVILSEWKTHEVVIEFELHQIREQEKQVENIHKEDLIQKIENKEDNDQDEKEQQKEENADDQGGEQSVQDSSVEIERELNKINFDQRRRRETEDELKLAQMFTAQKEKARIISKEVLKRIEAKAQKRAEVKKSDRTAAERKKQMTKDSKQSTDRKNKENIHHQRHDKSAFDLEDDERFFQSNSPKGEMAQSQSLSRSQLRDQIKMFRSRFGDRIYQNQNSTTMQKSILCFSMPKGPRFKYSKYNGVEPSYYVGTSFSSKNKGTSFGYGTRKPYPQWMVRNMHQNPAPNVYTVTQPPVEPSSSSKGFSFGISYKYYQKASIVGAQCSQRGTPKPGMFPKLSKPSTSNALRTPMLDTSKGHYHYRTGM